MSERRAVVNRKNHSRVSASRAPFTASTQKRARRNVPWHVELGLPLSTEEIRTYEV